MRLRGDKNIAAGRAATLMAACEPRAVAPFEPSAYRNLYQQGMRLTGAASAITIKCGEQQFSGNSRLQQ